MFAPVVRIDLLGKPSAQRFDGLVRELLPAIAAHEPSRLVQTVHSVVDAPLSRVFYEYDVDRAALEEHQRQPHTSHFLHEKDALLQGSRVEFLTPTGGTGT